MLHLHAALADPERRYLGPRQSPPTPPTRPRRTTAYVVERQVKGKASFEESRHATPLDVLFPFLSRQSQSLLWRAALRASLGSLDPFFFRSKEKPRQHVLHRRARPVLISFSFRSKTKPSDDDMLLVRMRVS